MSQLSRVVIFSLFFLFTLLLCSSDAYTKGQKLSIFLGKAGPYYNIFESYNYVTLPLCPPKFKGREMFMPFLTSDHLVESEYVLEYDTPSPDKVLCKRKFNDREILYLIKAIQQMYYFEFVLENVLMRGFLGDLKSESFATGDHSTHLWHHLHFEVEHNEYGVVFAAIVPTKCKSIRLEYVKDGSLDVEFSYSVSWKLSANQKEDVMKEAQFFAGSEFIDSTRFIGPLLIPFLLTVMVTWYLRRGVHRDFARYNTSSAYRDDMDDEANNNDSGWKLLHGDVFRPPGNLPFFSSSIGVGGQMLFIAVLYLLFFYVLPLFPFSWFFTFCIFTYYLTQPVAGFLSGKLYRQIGGTFWVKNINITSHLFTIPLVGVWTVLSVIASAYRSSLAMNWSTAFLLIFLWFVIAYPLSAVGAVLGKNLHASLNAPCRTRNIRREIPHFTCWKSLPALCLAAGLLQFLATLVEINFVFSFIWMRNSYDLGELVAIMLLVQVPVTGCVSVAFTYVQVSMEDYRWWWRTVLSCIATGLFTWLYAIYFFALRTNMWGVLQTVHFLGCSFLIAMLFGLALAYISFHSSLLFVKYLYRNIKID